MFSVGEIARLYRAELTDMGEHTPTLPDPRARRRGVLLCGGAGLMMSTLDQVPLRYACDADTVYRGPGVDVPSAMQMWARYHAPLVVMGWYTTRVPAFVLDGCRAIVDNGDAAALHVYSGGGLNLIAPGQWESLAPFWAHVAAALAKEKGPEGP